jgi:hypothetical protein
MLAVRRVSMPDNTPHAVPAGYTGDIPNHVGRWVCVYTRPHTPTPSPDVSTRTGDMPNHVWYVGLCLFQTTYAHPCCIRRIHRGHTKPCWQKGVYLYQTTHLPLVLMYPQEQGTYQTMFGRWASVYTRPHTPTPDASNRVNRGLTNHVGS